MIDRDEIDATSRLLGVHTSDVQRDYLYGWLLAGLYGDLLSSWLDRQRPPGQRASQEASAERAVSRHIRAMPFLWLNVPAGPDRGYLESNWVSPPSVERSS